MTETLVRSADSSFPEESGRRLTSRPVVLALFTVLIGLVAGAVYLMPQPPAEGSADVGFARDMSRHHAQAVAMAETIRSRTDDPTLRVLTADIALTQQAQIGMMSGWLTSWGRLQSSSGPQMAWMGRPTTGRMPGMASSGQVQALATLPVKQAEEQFLRLMVAHHSGGITMAKAGAELAEQPPIVALAEGIAAAQAAEIEYLQSLLAARGAPLAVVPDTALAHAATGHQGGGASARDTLLLAVFTLGLLAFLWLLIDAVTRQVRQPAHRLGAAAAVLIAAGVATAAVHLALAPSHAEQNTAFGLFFLLTSLTAVIGAALVLAGAARAGAVVLAGVSVLLIGVYVLFRLIPPPGAYDPEGVDAWGIVAVSAELVALIAAAVVLQRHTRAEPVPTLAGTR